jgi:hypothetical protein
MALRLRRGTDAQRLTLDGVALPVPAEGELIYTTDTKKLYVGDGATTGGIAVDVANSTLSVDDLSDVDITSVAPTAGQSLVWNDSDNEFQPGDATILSDKSINALLDVDTASNVPTVGQVLKWNGTKFVPNDDQSGGLVVGATYQINITGDVTGDVTGDTAGTHTGAVTGDVTGDLTGDVTGSVFADDSTTVIDGLNGQVLGNVVNSTVTTQDVNTAILRLSGLDSTGNNKAGIKITTDGNADDGYSLFDIDAATESDVGSSVVFTKSRGTHASRAAVQDGDEILGINYFGYDSANNPGAAAVIQVAVDGTPTAGFVPGSIVFGTTNPVTGTVAALTLNAQQTAVFGGAATFANMTTGVRNALTPAAGMVVFNTTETKLQVYTGIAWVDLH